MFRWPWSKRPLTPEQQAQADLLQVYQERKWQHYSPHPYMCPVHGSWACYDYREAFYYTTLPDRYRYPPGTPNDEITKFYPSRLYSRRLT